MSVLARTVLRAFPLLCLIAFPTRGRAQDLAAAEALFNKANADLEAGKYDTACPAFAESQRIDPRPGTLFALATCRDKQGQIATALATYEDYLRAVDQMTAALALRHHDRAKSAKERKATLAPDVPELTLTLPPGAPADVKIVRDGVAFTAASLGIAIPVNPGVHVIAVQIGDRPAHEQRITLQKGEKKTLVLELGPPAAETAKPATTAPAAGAAVTAKPAAPKAAVAQAPTAGQGTKPGALPAAPETQPAGGGLGGQRIGAIVAGAAGLAGIGLGAAMGAITLDKKGIADAGCTRGEAGLTCTPEGAKARQDAQLPGTLSTVGFGVGAAALAGAAVLWLTAKTSPPGETKGSVKDSRKVSGIVEIGPGGAAVGVKGVF